MKKQLFVSTALIVLATLINSPAFAQTPATTNPSEDSDKDQTIREMLDITGAKDLDKRMFAQVLTTLKAQYPKVPAKYWDTMAEEFNVDEFFNQLIPVYKKYYTNDDLKQLLAFYKTPIGKKTISVLPQLSSESIKISLDYAQTVIKKFTDKLKAEGYSPQK